MFSPINLEAEVHLIDPDSETTPMSMQAVTLIIRQGIEVLVKNSQGYPEAVVFIELSEGQIQALVWDIFSNPSSDEPTVHILGDMNTKEAKL